MRGTIVTMTHATPGPVLAIVRDLMFSSRISATARAEGVAVRILRDPAQLQGLEGSLLILDLNQSGAIEAGSAWLAEGKSGEAEGARHAVGFVSHVDAATIAAAKAAGIPQVLPRSRFVEVLPQLLKDGR